MLSIIISSYQPEYYNALEKNIAETCGLEYEIIKIDNPGKMGICEAYTRGAELAKYSYFLFLHEDVLFDTIHWGEKLIALLRQEHIGCVGLAGSSYVPNVPHKWWKNTGYAVDNVMLFQDGVAKVSFNPSHKLYKSYSVDGVFIACRRDVYREFLFNPKLTAYHGYDLDFSLRVSTKFQNYITQDITLLHYSGGNADKEWFKSILEARKNYKLPAEQKTDYAVETTQYKFFGEYVYKFCHSKTMAIKLLFKYFSFQKLGVKNILVLMKFCLYILRR